MAIEAGSSAEPFVLVDGPRPTESEHIYDHFFSEYPFGGYDAALIKHVHSRRAHADMDGVLFIDQLLSLALAEEVSAPSAENVYPPTAGKEGLMHLIERISSSTFDRIRRMALLYYLILDLDMHHGMQNATHLAKRLALPRSMRHAMTGYWNLDNGRYRIAVSYLQQPDFILKIIKILSPLPYAASSASETEERAFAFSAFTRLVDPSVLANTAEMQQARVVAVCWTQGIRAAWLQCRGLIMEHSGEEGETAMMQCIARILEFCFMPQPKADAVKTLLALPLTTPEEALLSHVVINPPPNIDLSPIAHATAIDVLLVRHINCGQYVEAVLLDRRVNSSLGLMHLSHDTHNEAQNEKLRRLRLKRQGLVKATLSVLTRIERMMLELGDDVKSAEAEDEDVRSDGSWERIPATTDASILIDPSPSQLVPLTASPAIRAPHPSDATIDPLLAAAARCSPARAGGSLARTSIAGSPLTRSFAASPSASQSVSLRKSIDSLRGTPARSKQSMPADISISSPLAVAKPYRLESMQQEQQSEVGRSSVTLDASGEMDHPRIDQSEGEASGPMARLAQQLEEQMNKNKGTVDEIFRRSTSVSASPFRVSSFSDKNAHSTMAMSRPPRRYEARYELGQESTTDKQDTVMTQDDHAAKEATEVPARRRARGRAPATRSKGRTAGQDWQKDEDGDTSVPGSFPGEMERSPAKSVVSDQAPKQRKGQKRSTTRKGARPTAGLSDAEDADAVPDLVQPSNMRKSRSAAGNLGRPKASTPLRRSTRLSVEPDAYDDRLVPSTILTPSARTDEGQVQTGDHGGSRTTRQRSSRSASPNKTKKATSNTIRTRRGASQAPTEPSEDEAGGNEPSAGGVTTRSSRRRKGQTDAIPGAF